MFYRLIGLLTIFLVIAGCQAEENEASSNFPSKTLELIAPATPGGGWDRTARSVQRTLNNQGVEQNVTVVNKPGGGGEVGWQYLLQQDSHYLALNSSLLMTGYLLGQSELSYESFTPISILSTEWLAVNVRADSEVEDAEDMMQQLKEDPKSLKIGVSPSLGSGNHLSFVQAAMEYGIDPKDLDFLVYNSGGDTMIAMLGGHIDIGVDSISGMREQYLADEVRILAITSDERVDEFPDVPTWTEQGVDVVFPHWRGLMGPPNMNENEIDSWDQMLTEMVETEEWDNILDTNGWEGFYMNSEETKAFLDEQHEVFGDILRSSGLAPE
ncbi:tripartite tricarboxylate transporter substrate binding protein [Alkalicoccobacillus porphyridii]|uniref:Tripartite tricarboxylate transporter substrate binding protein n=1 Tax=Alkalicoccobacillus porphyridii TaxID=2597270 RepID=A0A554A3Z2_9BACI|nr:tripartite tricarboxylate transporter substrate binding protein [Alkalicoccobacillus porphyridii]TSB48410.1 tripartite tricarboxylate transporter substrate binding protein [Alkalicoccobacillus porphyridii]